MDKIIAMNAGITVASSAVVMCVTEESKLEAKYNEQEKEEDNKDSKIERVNYTSQHSL